ncbi:ABC-type branched-chain amino acid transport system, substrate-binding protein [Loktanella sp. DSM 29012]|uniref:Penicillin-binding protein activator n=1 Tax=Loktanella gaetbuli TaxID=2881335 RepID=A0ABS8BX56_9RHOB|nr:MULTISPECIES: penicillin-binding protein activator [Loktanella]MCB5200335.1 penicillin-binding protein activator [Loktanella gaetbuli]SEP74028.1 ABC-type branched-chain amino acid transport system, substrate-binding protein [Loktanella sp. DSM 29012]
MTAAAPSLMTSRLRRAAAYVTATVGLMWMGACVPVGTVGMTQDTGQTIDASAPVQVALLVPGGSTQGANQAIASSLENAARMAISDLDGVSIDLRVYNSGSDSAQAAAVATRAVDEGAKIILGPLFADAANAAGVAVAPRNVNVLAFSNNTTIAGGNVFVLGATFENTADRLVRYASGQGISRIGIVHGDDLAGQVGRDAIARAVQANGASVAGIASYPLSQQGITASAGQVAATVKSNGADAVFLTAGVNADLPLLATALPEAGINPADTRYLGLTRWDAAPQALALPGLQGGLFAVPDRAMSSNFEARYSSVYGGQPHPLAGLAYDGIAAIGALVAQGRSDALTKAALTQRQGFMGTSGVFRLRADGTNERALSVATVRNNAVVILENAPRSFGRAGS